MLADAVSVEQSVMMMKRTKLLALWVAFMLKMKVLTIGELIVVGLSLMATSAKVFGQLVRGIQGLHGFIVSHTMPEAQGPEQHVDISWAANANTHMENGHHN